VKKAVIGVDARLGDATLMLNTAYEHDARPPSPDLRRRVNDDQ
jgi:hypothetical protein